MARRCSSSAHAVFGTKWSETAALAQFESCQRILDEELVVPPSTETIALVQRIRSGEFDTPGNNNSAEGRYYSTRNFFPNIARLASATHSLLSNANKNFLRSYTTLVDPDCRLLTLDWLGWHWQNAPGYSSDARIDWFSSSEQ